MFRYVMENKTLERECMNYKPDIELTGNDFNKDGNVDYGHILADRLIGEKNINELKETATFESNLSLIRKVKFYGLDNGVVENNRNNAINLIKNYGPYTALNYKGQKKGDKGIPLNDCTNHRLYQVLIKMYNFALKNINQSN